MKAQCVLTKLTDRVSNCNATVLAHQPNSTSKNGQQTACTENLAVVTMLGCETTVLHLFAQLESECVWVYVFEFVFIFAYHYCSLL